VTEPVEEHVAVVVTAPVIAAMSPGMPVAALLAVTEISAASGNAHGSGTQSLEHAAASELRSTSRTLSLRKREAIIALRWYHAHRSGAFDADCG